jgi:hypothetical protein
MHIYGATKLKNTQVLCCFVSTQQIGRKLVLAGGQGQHKSYLAGISSLYQLNIDLLPNIIQQISVIYIIYI